MGHGKMQSMGAYTAKHPIWTCELELPPLERPLSAQGCQSPRKPCDRSQTPNCHPTLRSSDAHIVSRR